MTAAAALATALEHARRRALPLLRRVQSTDPSIIARRYLHTAIFMALVGGAFAALFRGQLAFREAAAPSLSPFVYSALVTFHGTIMIFWVALPVLLAALGNALALRSDTRNEVPYPRLNRLGSQLFVLSAFVLLRSFLAEGGPFSGGWSASAPLSARGPLNLSPPGSSQWLIAIVMALTAIAISAFNVVVNHWRAWAAKRRIQELPLIDWMLAIAGGVFLIGYGPFLVGATLLFSDQQLGTAFYDPARGGNPMRWQSLFWFFAHSAIYVLVLPALGITYEIISAAPGRKSIAPRSMVHAAIGAGALSLFGFGEHLLTADTGVDAGAIAIIAAIAFALPVAFLYFACLAALARTRIRCSVPALWAIAFLAEFAVGAASGLVLGAGGARTYLHGTSFVVAHLHYALLPVAMFAVFAAVTHWYPVLFGGPPGETLGRIHFWGTVIPFNVVFIPMFALGLAGEPRHVYDAHRLPALLRPGLQPLRVVSTLALYVLLAFQLVLLADVLRARRAGAPGAHRAAR